MTFDARLTDAAIRYGPFCAPLPTAYLVADRIAVNLRWPLAVALVAGIAVEVVGLASVGVALALRSYQAGKRKADPDAPCLLAYALVGCYTVTVLALALGLDVTRQSWPAAVVLPLLSLSAFVALALHHDQRQRALLVADERNEERQRRASARLAKRDDALMAQAAASLTPDDAPVAPNDATPTPDDAPVSIIVAPQGVGIADWRSFVASLNGNSASLTFDDALVAMVERGLDAADKSQRDKVRRWWRDESQVQPS
jgi:hypothetical protein